MAEQVHEFRSRAGRDYQQSTRQNLVASPREQQAQTRIMELKKVEGQKTALKSLVTVLKKYSGTITLDKR